MLGPSASCFTQKESATLALSMRREAGIMTRRCKAVKLTKQGFLTDEKGSPLICPVRQGNCTVKCAWLSIEGKAFRCQDTVIGAVRTDQVRSFRLYMGPDVYDLEELLVSYEADSWASGPDEPLISSERAETPCAVKTE
jgi:hypothetical protein